MKRKVVYTIGHSNRSKEGFISLLHRFGIEALVDVRRFPTSKYEHFRKENLQEMLRKEGIDYVHMEELGGFRNGGYAEYTKTKEFSQAIKRLARLARRKTLALMCSERFYWRCHRKFIARVLKAMGFEVMHIIDENRVVKERKKLRVERVSKKR